MSNYVKEGAGEMKTSSENNGAKEEQYMIKEFINNGTSDETMLDFDAKGRFLIFEHEKGLFKELSDELVAKLSKASRTAYFVSKALNEKHDPKMDGRDALFSIGPTSEGRLGDQYSGTVAKDGLVAGTCRKDNLYKRVSQGFRVATKDDILATNAFLVESHFETKQAKNGETDQILIVTPKANAMRIRSEKDRINAEKMGEHKEALEASARSIVPNSKLIDE